MELSFYAPLSVHIPVRAIRSSFKQVKNLFLYQWTYIFITLFSTLAENFLFIIIPFFRYSPVSITASPIFYIINGKFNSLKETFLTVWSFVSQIRIVYYI